MRGEGDEHALVDGGEHALDEVDGGIALAGGGE
jgi:hypothetical protein